jgi:hypothetical protein
VLYRHFFTGGDGEPISDKHSTSVLVMRPVVTSSRHGTASNGSHPSRSRPSARSWSPCWSTVWNSRFLMRSAAFSFHPSEVERLEDHLRVVGPYDRQHDGRR